MFYWHVAQLAFTVSCRGKSTEVVENAGPDAHWFKLMWSIVITENNHLTFTVWSRNQGKLMISFTLSVFKFLLWNVAIGFVTLSSTELSQQPMDSQGNVTLFLKIASDSEKSTTGKLKVTCIYSQYDPIAEGSESFNAKAKGSSPDSPSASKSKQTGMI